MRLLPVEGLQGQTQSRGDILVTYAQGPEARTNGEGGASLRRALLSIYKCSVGIPPVIKGHSVHSGQPVTHRSSFHSQSGPVNPSPGEDLPAHVVEEAEVVSDLVPHLTLSTLDHQRALLERHRVDWTKGARLAALACEANLSGQSHD